MKTEAVVTETINKAKPKAADPAIQLIDDMRDRWFHLAERISARRDKFGIVWEAMFERYTDTSRNYHNLQHIKDCLDRASAMNTRSREVLLAIWFHDLMYVPGNKNNEHVSAVEMNDWCKYLGVDESIIIEAWRLIMITARHHEAFTRNEKIMADIDLAGLAAHPEVYEAAAKSIREEHAEIPDYTYDTGRLAFLNNLLAQEQIFKTFASRDAGMNEKARVNIKAEIETLVGTNAKSD